MLSAEVMRTLLHAIEIDARNGPARPDPYRSHGIHVRPRERRSADESGGLLYPDPARMGAIARERRQSE